MSTSAYPSSRLADPGAAPPRPLLVTGVAGVAGYNAFQCFHRQSPGEVLGIRRQDNFQLDLPGLVACNIDDTASLERLFEQQRFSAVLHAEGTCKLRSCELDPPLAWRINVLGAQNIAMLARRYDCRLVALSIDLVYSGERQGGYVEHDPTDPVTVYGKTMTQVEQIVLDELPSACVLRISLPMGKSYNDHAGAIDWIQSRFSKGRPATLYYDEIRTPTYCDCLNRLFALALTSDLRGLYHAGGPRRLSLYQIAQIVNRVGGYDPDLLLGCPRLDAGPMPPRAGNVAMISTKLSEQLPEATLLPWPLEDRWTPTHDLWHYARDGEFLGSPGELERILYYSTRGPEVQI